MDTDWNCKKSAKIRLLVHQGVDGYALKLQIKCKTKSMNALSGRCTRLGIAK